MISSWDLCPAGSQNHLFVCGVRPAVADILQHAVSKEKNLLLDNSDLPPERALGHLSDVLAVDAHSALGHVVKAGNQLAKGGFASTGGAHKGKLFPGFDVQLNVVKDLVLIIVSEGDVIKGNFAADCAHFLGVRGVLDVGFQAHQFQKPAEPRRAPA